MLLKTSMQGTSLKVCFRNHSSSKLVAKEFRIKNFGNGMRNLFSKQLIKCPRILSTSKRASIGDFPSKISAVKAIAKGPQLYLSICFWTGKKLTMNCFTQFLYNVTCWFGNFVESHSFRIVSGNSTETMRKVCLSTKFPHQEIRWNYGIFCSVNVKM